MEEKLKELLMEPDFQDKLEKTNSPEEASELLAQHGIQITPEELLKAFAQPEGELDENTLDGVAGGWIRWFPRPRWPRWPRLPHGPRWPRGSGGGGGSSW